MKTRLLAAAVGLGVVLPLLFLGGLAGASFVVFVAMVVCLGEYAQMAFPDDFRYAFYWLLLTALPLSVASLWAPAGRVPAIMAVLLMLTMVQVTLAPPEPLGTAADRLGRYILGVAWIGGLFPFVLRLRAWEDGEWWVFAALAISWLGDTGAYFAGGSLGRTKLYPLVSPNKTWEGVAGGIVTATLGMVVIKLTVLPILGWVDVVVLGMVGCGLGVLGDLAESLLKRSFDVKDSGWVMPGHGGLLDRVDSVLFVAPTVYGYMTLLRGL